MSLEPLALDNKVWTTKSELRRKFVRAKKLKFYNKTSFFFSSLTREDIMVTHCVQVSLNLVSLLKM